MLAPEFTGSYAKLRRAEHFIEELIEDMRVRGTAHFLHVRETLAKLEAGQNIPQFDTAQSLHPGVIVGDAIHNLRAALDLMASELADIRGQDRNRIKFPFSRSLSELNSQIKDKCFHLAGDDAVDLLRRIAPYHGGNQALRNLHDLDIQDKHTTLIVTTTAWKLAVRTENGKTVPDISAASVVGMRFEYLFPTHSVFAGEGVIPTLKSLVELVESILQAFAALVAARPS